VRSVQAEMDQHPIGVEGNLSFTDDFSLTGFPPGGANRFYRIRVVR
jgi:hypothetical protein